MIEWYWLVIAVSDSVNIRRKSDDYRIFKLKAKIKELENKS